jgi:hypothetical protein
VADEVSNAELARQLERVHQDLQSLGHRLDAYVLREVYAAERERLMDRLAALERQAKDAEDQRRSDRKWLISAVLIPIAVVLVQVILGLQGPG